MDLSWSAILGAWNAVQLDLQDTGIDLSSGVLHQRGWGWLELRIWGLVANKQSRLYTRLRIT